MAVEVEAVLFVLLVDVGGVVGEVFEQIYEEPGDVNAHGEAAQQGADEHCFEQAAPGAGELKADNAGVGADRGVYGEQAGQLGVKPRELKAKGNDGQQVPDNELYEQGAAGQRKDNFAIHVILRI